MKHIKRTNMLGAIYHIRALSGYGVSNLTEQGWQIMDYYCLPTRQQRVVWFVVDSMKQEEGR